jgi:tetratricopeptide (TPR) repeat protein
MLVGEPGIGKTRLLEELRATAQGEATQVLWGTGFQAEMMRPYGLWIDVLRSLPIAATEAIPAELGFLLPELGQPTQRLPDPSHLFDAVVRSLIMCANQSPLVLLLDDIQWLDEASAALLHYAIRVLRSHSVWLACSARQGELAGNAAISGVLQALRRDQRLKTLEVLPLDREQTADLMRHTAATVPELSLALVNQVFIDSGGNPLFALEIARSLEGQHPPTSASTVETLIHDRLQQLDEPAKGVLPWAAALGRSFQPAMVAEVAEYPLLQLLTAIEHLEQQAIIRPSASQSPEMGYDFAHDIVRQVVYQQLSTPRRQLIHRQIAHKLQHQAGQDDTIASQIAHHASLGGDYVLALTAAAAAAERCLKLFAYAEALELAHQGLQQCQHLDSHVRLLGQARLLRVCVMAGVTSDNALYLEAEVQQLVQSAQSLGYPDVEAIALETLLILQFERSNFSEVHHHSTRAVEVSRMASSPATATRMLAHSGTCLAEIGHDIIRAEALLLEAQTLATKAGLKNCDVFSGLGCIHLHCGRYDEARSNLKQAWQLAKAQQYHWHEFNYLSYLVMTELEAGDLMTALSYCDELSAVAAQIQGEGSEAVTAQALTALARYQMAAPNAATDLEAAIAALQQVDAKRKLAYVLTRAAVVDLQQARLEQAINRAKLALTNAQIVNHPSEIALSWAILLQGLVASGNHEQAIAEFAALSPILNSHDLSLQAKQAIDQILPALQPHSQPKL